MSNIETDFFEKSRFLDRAPKMERTMRKTKFETGNYYHVLNRGNERKAIFFETENYLFFLRRLILSRLGWCAMPRIGSTRAIVILSLYEKASCRNRTSSCRSSRTGRRTGILSWTTKMIQIFEDIHWSNIETDFF